MAVSWGWREVTFGTGDHQRKDWEPQGEHIGWVDGTNVYLQSDSAYAVVQKLARDGGDQIAVGLPTMKKRLHERGLLASTETSVSDGRVVERLDVRRSLQGKRRTVLHLNSPSWTSTTPDSVPSAPCVPIKEDTRLGEGTDGTQNGTQTEATRVVVYQDRAPAEDEVVPEPTDSGTHGALGTQILEGTPATSALKRKPHWEESL
jgi:hypothetical protein